MKNKKIIDAYDQIQPDDCTKKRIWNQIMAEKSQNNNIISYKKRFKTRKIIVAICLVTMLASLSVMAAGNYFGINILDKENKKEVLAPFSTYNQDRNEKESTQINSEDSTGILSEEEIEKVFADTFGTIDTQRNGELFSIPEFYLSPVCMAILTVEGQTWELEKGDSVNISFALDSQSLDLEIGYIKDGIYYSLTEMKGDHFSAEFKVPESGTYYFGITNHSSQNAILIDGEILTE